MSGCFLEERLPIGIAYGSSGGPSYSTQVVSSFSGYEQRNANWEHSRHTFEWDTCDSSDDDLEVLLQFFHSLKGAYCGFRVRDHLDYKSCPINSQPAFDDQVIGQGDGSTLIFQLKKTYTYGLQSTERIISKPDPAFVPLIGVLGIERLQSDAEYPWSWDSTTGHITFGVAPPSGDVTAGYQFDVPARFSTDNLRDVYLSYQLGRAPVPIIEIRVD